MVILQQTTSVVRGRRLSSLLSSRATAPVGVGLFGMVFTAAASWIPSPWYDEAATISATTRTLPELFALLQNVDAVHGVYYTLMHFWLGLVGFSPFALRLPSAVAVGLTAAALVVLMRRLASRRTALVAGLVFCLLPRVTWMGTEGRSYALSTLLAVALTLVFLGAWGWGARDRRQRSLAWITYGVLAWIACTSYLYLALLVVAHGVTALLLAAHQQDRPTRRGLSGWLLAATGAALAGLSLVIDEVQQSRQVDWIGPLDASTLKHVLVSQWFLGNTTFAWIGWSLVLIGIATLVAPLLRGRRLPTGSVRLMAVVLPWMIVPPALLLLATAVATPLYSARYLTFGVPTVAILIAVAFTAPRRFWIAAAGLLLCVTLTVPSYLHQRSENAKQNSSWGQVAALISTQRAAEPRGQQDAVVYGPLRRHRDANMSILALVYPQQLSGLVDLKQGELAAERATLWNGRIPLADTRSRLGDAPVVWLITSDKRDWRPSVGTQLALWDYRVDTQWHLDGVNVVRYLRD
ncbi:MAG: glycosyltransferase family 39 protein [Pseudolysinimonas sp.]